MKTKNASIWLGICCCGILLFAMACKKERLLNLTDGVILNVNTDILDTPISIGFVNTRPGGAVPNDISVDILGDGAPDIYTLTGSQEFTIIQGLVNIGIEKGITPTPENPLAFSIFAKPKGFLPIGQRFVITDKSVHQHHVISMLEINDLPEGVSKDVRNMGANNNGVSQTKIFETPLTNGKEEGIKVTFQAGTKIFDAEGQPLMGTLKTQLVHFDNRSEPSLEALGGFLEGVPAYTPNGISMGLQTMEPLGLYMLDVMSSNEEGATFSAPIEVVMTLNESSSHPVTGEIVKAGDVVPVWSLDETNFAWMEEGTATVEEGPNGKLQVVYLQEHLSIWMVGYPMANCQDGATLKFSTSIPEDACDRYYLMDMYNANTNKRLARTALTFHKLNNGSAIDLVNVPADIPVFVKIWDGVRDCTGNLVAETPVFDPCGGVVEVNLPQLSDNNWYPITVSVSGFCETAGPDFLIAPTGNVLYRPAGCGKYGYLGMVSNGAGCTATLRKGQSYDFKVRYGRSVYEYLDLKMESIEFSYTLSDGTEVPVRVKGGNTSAELIFEGMPIPEDYCSLFDE